MLLLALPAAAQSARTGERGEFFLGASAKTAAYSIDGTAFGGGLSAGYDFDIGALGVSLDYLADPDGLATLTPGLFLRFYIPLAFINAEDRFRSDRFRSGPFLQFDFGPSFHAWDLRLPSGDLSAAVSAGLSAGWRFLLGDRWYVEPALRGGYPFIAGGGVAAGIRF
jgi:hypothetical protein